jgi:hypothetical protein
MKAQQFIGRRYVVGSPPAPTSSLRQRRQETNQFVFVNAVIYAGLFLL